MQRGSLGTAQKNPGLGRRGSDICKLLAGRGAVAREARKIASSLRLGVFWASKYQKHRLACRPSIMGCFGIRIQGRGWETGLVRTRCRG